MKNWWALQSARIDALGLRERVLLFLALLVCCMLLTDVLWLSPAQTEHQQLSQRFTRQSAELQRLRDELKASGKSGSPSQQMRGELAQVKHRLEEVNRDIAGVSAASVGAASLAQVLVHFLRRHEGLTLVRTLTLAPEASAAKGGPAESVPAGLTRQGLELTVSGSYPELMRYVQSLEKALPTLRWGSMKLGSEKQPPQLTVQVFLVGVQP